jgi:perosamine synthetase
MLIAAAPAARKITAKTSAIVAVDYAGQPADYDALRALVVGRSIALIADACHAPGATYKGRRTGTLADVSCFSFHPVKHLTTCEGGMALTDNVEMAAHMQRFRNHGIDMRELGFNYRLPDVQCALGLAQLTRLQAWVAARQRLAALYDQALSGMKFVEPLQTREDRTHARHL